MGMQGMMQENGNARHDASQKTIKNSTLLHSIGILANQAKATKRSTAAYSAITTAIQSSLFPIFSHDVALVSNFLEGIFIKITSFDSSTAAYSAITTAIQSSLFP